MAVRNVYVAGANGIGYTKEVDSSADYASLANDTYFKDRSLGIGGLIRYKDVNGDILDIFAGAVQPSTDITHAELVSAKAAGELVPGVMYRITDFQTIYDQPDFNADGTPKTNPTVKTGPVEPIIVTAISDNELGVDAFQEDHPNDTIQYILEFTTPVTGTETKGRIIKRIDDYGNESDFDHRNVLFKRYMNPQYGDYFEYKDNGEAYQEFLAITPNPPYQIGQAPMSAGNYLGDTFTYYLSNSGSPGSVQDDKYDLPNIVLGIYGPSNYDAFTNNKLNGYIMNFTIWEETSDLLVKGPAVNVMVRRFSNNVIGRMWNVYSKSEWGGNVINSMFNLDISGLGNYGNTIGEISGLSGEIRISGSTISEIWNNTIIQNGKLEIINSTINQFRDNTINARAWIFSNKINTFSGNTIKSFSITDQTGISYNEFSWVVNNVFGDDFGYNKGNILMYNEFKGRVFGNDFGKGVSYSVFGTRFGNPEYLEFNGGYGEQDGIIGSKEGNVFKSWASNLEFGTDAGGNVFNTELAGIKFGDYLTNNEFDDNFSQANFGQISLTDRFELYERFKTRVFALPEPHNYTYSIGDAYVNEAFVYGFFLYRSETANDITVNYFINRNSSNNNDLAVWQATPSLLGTVDGLGQSKKNTRILKSNYSTFALPISLSHVAIYELGGSTGVRGYLPTLAELQEIYNNRVSLGLTTTNKVWSSTEYDATHAWVIDFATGTSSYELKSSQFTWIPIFVKTYDYRLKLEYVDTFGSTTIVDL